MAKRKGKTRPTASFDGSPIEIYFGVKPDPEETARRSQVVLETLMHPDFQPVVNASYEQYREWRDGLRPDYRESLNDLILLAYEHWKERAQSGLISELRLTIAFGVYAMWRKGLRAFEEIGEPFRAWLAEERQQDLYGERRFPRDEAGRLTPTAKGLVVALGDARAFGSKRVKTDDLAPLAGYPVDSSTVRETIAALKARGLAGNSYSRDRQPGYFLSALGTMVYLLIRGDQPHSGGQDEDHFAPNP